MTEQEIRENAPSGAKFYNDDTASGMPMYYKVEDLKLFICKENGEWVESLFCDVDAARLKPL